LRYGTPTIIKALQSYPLRLYPSEKFPLATAKSIGDSFFSQREEYLDITISLFSLSFVSLKQ